MIAVIPRISVMLAVLMIISGCATVIKGTTQDIPISSDPSGAEIFIDGMLVGTTPASIEVKRKRDHLVVIQKTDYEPKSIALVKNIGGAVCGNIITGGPIGWGVDDVSGSQNNLFPSTISVKLEPAREGDLANGVGANWSVGIRKLNVLDEMRENGQITYQEYARGRIALIETYFPELIRDPEDQDSTVFEVDMIREPGDLGSTVFEVPAPEQ